MTGVRRVAYEDGKAGTVSLAAEAKTNCPELWEVDEVVTVCPEGLDICENLWICDTPGDCLAVVTRSRSRDLRVERKDDEEDCLDEVL